MKHFLFFIFSVLASASVAQRIELNNDARAAGARYDENLPDGVLFYEGFENSSLPALPSGWSAFGVSAEPFITGTAGNAPGQANANGFWNVPLHGIFAVTNDDVCNCDKSQERLRSRAFDLVGLQNIQLQFSAYQDGSAGQSATLDISTSDLPWTSLYSIPSSSNWKTHRIEIPNAFLKEGFKFRFRYDDNGNYASGLAVDDIYMYRDDAARFALESFFSIEGDVLGSGQFYDQIPVSQAREAQLIFGGSIANDADQRKNAQLAVDVQGPVVFGDTSASWHLVANETRLIGFDENERFTPHLSGTYNLVAAVLTDSGDSDLSDNDYAASFTVGDTLYQRTAIPLGNTAGVWLEQQGDRYGSVYHMFKGDTVDAVYVRIHPSTQAGARFRLKIFSFDTLTSSSFSSSPITVASNDIGTSMRIPLNTHISRGKKVLTIEKESGSERLVIGADPSKEALEGNALTRKAGQDWKAFSFFPLTALVLPAIDTACPGYITSSVTDETCQDEDDGIISTEVFGANIPFTYNWSNGAGNVSSVEDLAPGFYDLFVIDAQNCIYEKNFEIHAAEAVVFNPILTIDSCARSTGVIDLNISGGDEPFSLTWNGKERSAFESGLSMGNYAVQLTDENGCQASTSVSLGGTEDIGFVFLVDNSDCLDSNGSIEVTPFGTPPFSYAWSNGDSTALVSSLFAGIYHVTLTDSVGCTTSSTTWVNDVNGPSTSVSSISDVRCFGQADGSVSLTTGGGLPPYLYSWSNGTTTEDLTGLEPGMYALTVSDTAGCRSFRAVEIQNDALPFIVDLNAKGNYCFSDSSGILEAIINGGAAPYTMNWSTGASSTEITDLAAGTYHYIITDNNGCDYADSIEVSDGMFFAAQIDSIYWDTVANFLDENKIYVHSLGGVEPISYVWNDSIQGKDLINVPTGSYTLIATDQLGCSILLNYLLQNGPSGLQTSLQTPFIKLYPNPVQLGQSVQFQSSTPVQRIVIRDLAGQVFSALPRVMATSGVLSLGGLPSGIYLVEFSTQNALLTERICVFR
ncbi:MAG: T9SS type A sorting domain-containing protein [Flavobacteriales bacterium]|nr:T9SS type A sorting domain-containing protein [Flavobacteriales bacterium]